MRFALETDPKRARTLPFVAVWLILLLLGGLSLWAAFLGLGMWTPAVQSGIAAIQTALVFTVFMRLKGEPSLKWVFAVGGFLWLSFLFGLSMTDYSSRQGWPTMYDPSGPSYQLPRHSP